MDVEGDKVILRGYVGSWSEKEDAERVAWSAPGVSAVENHLIVVQSTPTWMRVVCLLLVVALLVVTLMWPALAYLNTRQQQSPNGPPRIWIQAPETEQP